MSTAKKFSTTITEEKKQNGKSYSPKHWRIHVICSYKEEQPDGTLKTVRKRASKVTHGTKAEAQEISLTLTQELEEKLAEPEQQEKVTTLSDVIELWDNARHMANSASERTLKESRTWLRHVEAHLGSTPIQDITPQMVEELYAQIRTERNLSSTSMNHIHTLLKSVFNKAIDYDIIYKNPCTRVVVPRRDDPKRHALTKEESARLLQAVDESELTAYKELEEKEARMEHIGKNVNRTFVRGVSQISGIIAVRIGLATGMRRGEVMGLTWQNVDLESNLIKVCQSLTSTDTIKTPKTAAGIRTVSIDPVTSAHLSVWKEHQAKELAKIGLQANESTPVCCSNVATWFNVDRFQHWWNNWRNAHGFQGLKFHELRHTQATLLLANGVDVKTVQSRLGHASPSITLGWYAHAIPQNDSAAALMLCNLLASEKKDFMQNNSSAQNRPVRETNFCSRFVPDGQTTP